MVRKTLSQEVQNGNKKPTVGFKSTHILARFRCLRNIAWSPSSAASLARMYKFFLLLAKNQRKGIQSSVEF